MTDLAWTQGRSKETLDEFLTRCPPSKTYSASLKDNGEKWIWVRSSRGQEEVESGSSSSIEDARKVLDDLVERYQEIEESPKIPKVKSKTSGPSKKMCKESAAQKAEKQLREVGKQWPCGKWLFFERVNYVDLVFSILARSIIDGPLSRLANANCHTIKVATADTLTEGSNSNGSKSHGREPTFLVCLYFDVIWNAQHAKEVLECIVKEHGQIPNSAKADLYTVCGLDSNHPSKLRSTLYRPAEIFNTDLIKEWQIESRARARREAEEGKKGKKDNDDNNTDESSRKRRMISDGSSWPVKPEDFWLESQGAEDEEGFEKTTTDEKTVISETNTKAQKESPTPALTSNKTRIQNEEDSDTENEEDDIINLHVPQKKSSSTAKETPSKAEAPPALKQEPLSESSNTKGTSSVKSEPRQTVLKPSTTTTNKKRDRFGRSDF